MRLSWHLSMKTAYRLRIYLYHTSPVSQVLITLPLIERLLKAYPGTVAGVKDSSGVWNNTAAMLKEFQPKDSMSSRAAKPSCCPICALGEGHHGNWQYYPKCHSGVLQNMEGKHCRCGADKTGCYARRICAVP